jgi:hypothetical protein
MRLPPVIGVTAPTAFAGDGAPRCTPSPRLALRMRDRHFPRKTC